MAKWVKTHEGEYVNLSHAISVNCLPSAHTDFRVLAYFPGDEDRTLLVASEQECRDWMRENIGVVFRGVAPGGKEYRNYIPGEMPDEVTSVEDTADSTVNKSSEKDYGSNKRTRFQRD